MEIKQFEKFPKITNTIKDEKTVNKILILKNFFFDTKTNLILENPIRFCNKHIYEKIKNFNQCPNCKVDNEEKEFFEKDTWFSEYLQKKKKKKIEKIFKLFNNKKRKEKGKMKINFLIGFKLANFGLYLKLNDQKIEEILIEKLNKFFLKIINYKFENENGNYLNNFLDSLSNSEILDFNGFIDNFINYQIKIMNIDGFKTNDLIFLILKKKKINKTEKQIELNKKKFELKNFLKKDFENFFNFSKNIEISEFDFINNNFFSDVENFSNSKKKIIFYFIFFMYFNFYKKKKNYLILCENNIDFLINNKENFKFNEDEKSKYVFKKLLKLKFYILNYKIEKNKEDYQLIDKKNFLDLESSEEHKLKNDLLKFIQFYLHDNEDYLFILKKINFISFQTIETIMEISKNKNIFHFLYFYYYNLELLEKKKNLI
jgi:hypothetical protein